MAGPELTPTSALLDRFAGLRILVLGDVMLDEYVWGTVNRISPEAPIPIVEVNTVTVTPGGAANVAVNLKSLGAEPILIGLVGADEPADRLRRALVDQGISDEHLIVEDGRPTTLKTRIVAHGQQMLRADRESRRPIEAGLAHRIGGELAGRIAGAHAVLISDYGKGFLTETLVGRAIEAARDQNRPVTVDPKGLQYGKYRRASIVTPNEGEAARASHLEIYGEADLLEAGRRLLAELETEAILITRGEQGMSLFEPGERIHHLPTYAREVYDVTGAGDTVIATMTLALAAGAPYRAAAELANRAAGVVVGKVGTASLSVADLERAIDATI